MQKQAYTTRTGAKQFRPVLTERHLRPLDIRGGMWDTFLMGSKVQIIDQECERHYGKIGYVCEWRHKNQDGKCFVTVYVQFLDDTDGWFDAESIREIS